MEKKELILEGKAKRLYTTEDEALVIQEFKDDASAFNGVKKGSISKKGEINCAISSIFFEYLESYHVPTHFIQIQAPNEMLVKKVDIVLIEAVMRNIATGSLVKRLGFQDGKALDHPVFEIYLKNDDLGDPLINEYHAYALGIALPDEIRSIFRITAKVNAILKSFLERRGLILVDFKLEFGRDEKGELIIADEISPDTCRFWDRKTHKKLDKDRFRFDMGGVDQAYQEILERISKI
ncbi:MAG: phosphoribosylaminoimidazolesuccinocarboxamide synthase [Candidatus Hatepunaea meridiana]|nr:phosphoribosylaminoimidazolesuccinocarboxamide synthase [Candidatus Hatepunaea meridiana]